MQTHKHKGVERSNGTLRAHPVDRKHKDSKVITSHNKSLKASQSRYKQGATKKSATKKIITRESVVPKKKTVSKQNFNIKASRSTILVPVDADGYISLDLDKSNTKGLRVTFTRKEGRTSNNPNLHRKTVGIQFENNPDLRTGNFHSKKLVYNKSW